MSNINKDITPRLPKATTVSEKDRAVRVNTDRYSSDTVFEDSVFTYLPTRHLDHVIPSGSDFVYITKPGDDTRLYNIAHRFYNNVNLWWVIADRNRGVVTNPLRVPVGTTLFIPPISVVYGEIIKT